MTLSTNAIQSHAQRFQLHFYLQRELLNKSNKSTFFENPSKLTIFPIFQQGKLDCKRSNLTTLKRPIMQVKCNGVQPFLFVTSKLILKRFKQQIHKIFIGIIHDFRFVYTSCALRWSYLFRREMPLVF